MTNLELLDKIKALCEEAGVRYLVQVDDGETIDGIWSANTNSRLYNMVKGIINISDSYEEKLF